MELVLLLLVLLLHPELEDVHRSGGGNGEVLSISPSASLSDDSTDVPKSLAQFTLPAPMALVGVVEPLTACKSETEVEPLPRL